LGVHYLQAEVEKKAQPCQAH